MNQLTEQNDVCMLSITSRKMDRIMGILTQRFTPFNQLSSERLSEVINLVRFIEMRSGEIFQIRGGKDHDYLFVLEGHLEMVRDGVVRSIAPPEGERGHPTILAKGESFTTLMARDDAIICHAERQVLDHLISWDMVTRDMKDMSSEVRTRMEQVRNSLVFRRLPWESVEAAFERMKTISVKAGDEVVKQGEEGDAFYIITAGRAEVWQRGMLDDTPMKIAEIGEGDAFGCEALISGKTRNETVRMLEDGSVLTLGKDDFNWLISKQMIKAVNSKVALTMLETGYQVIDVRSPEEFEYGHLPNAQLIPLFELRQRMSELDIKQRYIIYCHSGSRSSVAALRLTQAGYDVQTLEGGFREWPYETVE